MTTICKTFLITILLAFCYLPDKLEAQEVKRVEPPFWWTDMKNTNLQLMVYGEDIGNAHVELDNEYVKIRKIHPADNPNYLFIDLTIESAAPAGQLDLKFNWQGKQTTTYPYQIKERRKNVWAYNGLTQNDVIYLITPDRFVNGNPENDEDPKMAEGINRDFKGGRHGGDIEGVINKLDYMQDLGVTAVWLNPVLENNMPEYSYHGYSTTDYYKVDPRFGSNEKYLELADQLHSRKMKLIMDMVFNHCGLQHWWMKDLPFDDWIHSYPNYEITNHAKSAFSDPYAAQVDLKSLQDGWFVPTMPDLNHDNPFMANYLIQNSIWWIEYAGLDGIRMDTYPYNEPEMMKEWANRVYSEYPDFYLVGETWVDNEAEQAFWADKKSGDSQFDSDLNSMTDFPLCNAIQSAFKPDGDVKSIYNVICKDFLYLKPQNNKIFFDNHDMDRFFQVIDQDLDKFKLASTVLLTMRGIPTIYYGTEILMKQHGNHGLIREDFPGGWETDSRNGFKSQDRTPSENEAFEHIRKLLTWRKHSNAIASGSLIHFLPHENVYVYARKSEQETVVVIINNNSVSKDLALDRYREVLEGYAQGWDILTERNVKLANTLSLSANASYVLQLKDQSKTSVK